MGGACVGARYQSFDARRTISSNSIVLSAQQLTLGERMKPGTGAKVRSLAISTLISGIGFRLGTVCAANFPCWFKHCWKWCGDSSRKRFSLIQVNTAEWSLPPHSDLDH
jgi:hypothetical protein